MLWHGASREPWQEAAGLLQSFIKPSEQWLDLRVDRGLDAPF